jgi:hypothetical protein
MSEPNLVCRRAIERVGVGFLSSRLPSNDKIPKAQPTLAFYLDQLPRWRFLISR